MEHRKPKAATNAPCRKHPNHRQSPGVCSLCLSEKLSQLPLSSAKPAAVASPLSYNSSSSSSDLSSLSSSCSSPVSNVLAKSRSMAAFVRRRDEDANGKKVARIKRGFWTKLLRRKGKGLLMHSKSSLNERIVKPVH